MAAQDQRGDVQARWRLSEKPSTRNAVMAVHRLGETGAYVPATRAQGQGAGAQPRLEGILELVSLHTVLLGRGGVLS
jgi:hypothetical protein